MKLLALTRGTARDSDYRFFGGDRQPTRWWNDEPWSSIYSTEAPGLALRMQEDGSWELLLASIPTGRKDVTQARVSLSLLLIGNRTGDDSGQDDWIRASTLAHQWVDAIGSGQMEGCGLTARLERELPREKVDSWFVRGGHPQAQSDLEDLLARLLDKQAGQPGGQVGTPGEGVWAGGVANPDARARFLRALIGLFGDAARGRAFAFVCPFLDSTQALREVLPTAEPRRLYALTTGNDGWEQTGPKAPPGPGPGQGMQARRVPGAKVWMVVLVVIKVVLLAVIVAVICRRAPT